MDTQRPQKDETATVNWASVMVAALAAAGATTALDVLRGGPTWQRFLPHGSLQLWVFVGCLYGAVFSLSALVAQRLLSALVSGTLLRVLFRGHSPLRLSRAHQVLLLGLPPLLVGASLYPIERLFLHLFHHRGLIALLSCAVAASLVPAAMAVVLMLQALLPRGAHRHLVLHRGPLSLYAAGWAVGLLAFAGGEAFFLLRLLDNPRMDGPLRALNLALWTPLILCAGLFLGHLIGRGLAKRIGAKLPLAHQPAAVVGLPLLVLGLAGLAVWIGYQSVLKQIDLRALQSVTVAVLVLLAWLWLVPVLRLGRWRFLLLALPLCLWAFAVELGQIERVRKAAQAGLPLTARMLHVIARVFDVDRDGVASHLAIGGGDCDDFDPEVFPGAFDWPDDGIDQNCNGHDAHPRAARPATTALPSSLPTRPNIVLLTVDALWIGRTNVVLVPWPGKCLPEPCLSRRRQRTFYSRLSPICACPQARTDHDQDRHRARARTAGWNDQTAHGSWVSSAHRAQLDRPLWFAGRCVRLLAGCVLKDAADRSGPQNQRGYCQGHANQHARHDQF